MNTDPAKQISIVTRADNDMYRSPRTIATRLLGALHTVENGSLAFLLLLMASIPVIEFLGRRFAGVGIRGANDYVQHLTLWVGFLGGMVASREGKHLRIGVAVETLPGWLRRVASMFAGVVSVAVCSTLAWASLRFIVAEAPAAPEALASWIPSFLAPLFEDMGLFEDGALLKIGGWISPWVIESIMPIGFIAMTLRFIIHTPGKPLDRFIAGLGLPIAIGAAVFLGDHVGGLVWPAVVVVLLAAMAGAPIFILLGGIAALLLWNDGVTVAAIPVEAYRIAISPIFPTIPIFTLVGFILSESQASKRLGDAFHSCFGWFPGGAAVAATLVCAFFTTFTGASGVTILALGGLLLPTLIRNGFSEKFSVGLLTSTGSLGLLLPPSLVIILYGVVAQVPIVDMFVAGIVPGTVLVILFCIVCVRQGLRVSGERDPFNGREALRHLRSAIWEAALPLVVIVLMFGGFCTLVEAAAMTALYALFIESIVHRDLSPKAILQLLTKAGTLVGGVLVVLGAAMGLTSYLVDAQVPMHAAEWVREHIHNRWLFLLALNGGLILVGCLMDIYSALFVVVPLVLPMAEVFDIDPIHLGIIFLANLQLGYLTPPIGMNLFLASFRFDRPVMRVAKDALPFLILMAIVVLLITYVPALSLAPLKLVAP